MKTLSFPRIAFLLVPIVFLFSCKKDSPIESLKKPDKVDGVTKEALLKDSVYYYTDYFYLWQDQLPALGAFKPSIYKTAEEVLTALKSYAKDSNGKSLDRFSFLDRTGAVNESIQEGLSGSFGFDVRYNNENDLFVKQVYPGSPADVAGIKRGWKLLEINGNTKCIQLFFFKQRAGCIFEYFIEVEDGGWQNKHCKLTTHIFPNTSYFTSEYLYCWGKESRLFCVRIFCFYGNFVKQR